MMRKTLALAALAVGLAATPALAQGGLYVGAIGGYEGLDVEASDGSVTADVEAALRHRRAMNWRTRGGSVATDAFAPHKQEGRRIAPPAPW